MNATQIGLLTAVAGVLSVASLLLTWRRLRPLTRRRRAFLLGLRGVAIGCVALMVVNPAVTRTATVQSPPCVVVLLDRSASMSTKDAPGGMERLAWAGDLLRSGGPLARVLASAEPTYLLFADGVRQTGLPIGDSASGDATNIEAALAAALKTSAAGAPEAAILVSDGAANRGATRDELTSWVRRQRLPVYCLGVGSDKRPPDAWVAGVQVPRVVKAESEASIAVALGSRGLDGKRVRVSLKTEGLGQRAEEVELAGGGRRRVAFRVRPTKPGFYRCTVEFPPLPGEWTAGNNSRTFFLRVEPGTAELLFVAGRPSREFKFIRRVLDNAPDLRVTYLVRKSGGTFWVEGARPQAGRRLPADRALNEQDAVILCDVPASAFSEAELGRLDEFVRTRGGGLGMIGGSDSFGAGGYGGTPLAAALGVRLAGDSGFSAVPIKVQSAPGGPGTSPVGDVEQHEDFPGWAALPLVAGVNEVSGVKPGATAQLVGPGGQPLLVIQRYGPGRSLCWLGVSTFRWVLSKDATPASRKGHAVFWTGIANWLTTPPNRSPVALETDRDVYESGDTARVIVHVSDQGFRPVSGAKVVAGVSGGEGDERLSTLAEVSGAQGTYEVSLPVGRPGKRSLKARVSVGGQELGSDSREIIVEAPRGELADPAQNVSLLKEIAEASGAAYIPADRIAELPGLIRLPRATRAVWSQSRWARSFPGLLAFLCLAGVDWFLRRWWGVG